ncbi:hypothetical protein LCGC14_1677650 [marine sediment metagenome]|uniref:Uncharacterized protein n=1 Tax=marine sediment metagenome TaxID=412755 RepID=A0A0F9HQ16_9ZZZZ
MKKIKTKLKTFTKYMPGHRNQKKYDYKVTHIYHIYEDNDGKIYELDLGNVIEVHKEDL